MRVIEDLEQAHIAYAFPGLSTPMPIIYVAQLYATALGGGMSSRLFQEVREKRGLCYSIYAFSNDFQDGGFLGIYVGTGENDAGEISAVIAGEMEAMTGNLTESEVARAKAQLKSRLLMGLERPGTRAEQIAGQLFALGRVQSAAEIVAQLDAIDAAAVKRLCRPRDRRPAVPPSRRWARRPSWKPHHVFAAPLRRARQIPAGRGGIMVKAALAKTGPIAFMRGLTFPGGQQPVIRGAGRLSALSAHRRLSDLGEAARRKPRIPHPLGAGLGR